MAASGAHRISWVRGDLKVERDNPASVLGHGGFGIVRRGKYLNGDVAVKELLLSAHAMSEETKEEFYKEAALHASLHFPHVVQFYGLCLDGPAPMMVMEMMARSLSSYLHNKTEVI